MKCIFTSAVVCCFVLQIQGMQERQQLTPNQIEQKRNYYCTSLVELCYSKMVHNYKQFLTHTGDDKTVPHDVKEGIIKRLTLPGALSITSPKKNKFFFKYIATYKKLNQGYCRSIVQSAENCIDRLFKLKKIGEALHETEPDLLDKGRVNYLKRHLSGNTKLYTFDTGEIVLNLDNSHVFLFDNKYALKYSVGSLHTKLTTLKCKHVGQRKCVFVGDEAGRVYIATTEEGGFSAGQLSGSIIDFVVSSDSEDRVAVHCKQGQDKKVAVLRANETYLNTWFIGSRIHSVEENKVETVEFSKKNGQLVTHSPKGKKRWDFVYNDTGSKVLQEVTVARGIY